MVLHLGTLKEIMLLFLGQFSHSKGQGKGKDHPMTCSHRGKAKMYLKPIGKRGQGIETR
jgi:hypothetical protein